MTIEAELQPLSQTISSGADRSSDGLPAVPVRIKLCGITDPDTAQFAALCGVDAIGLVFVPASSRYVTIAQAQAIITALPPYVSVVALFQDESSDTVAQVLAECSVDMLQFHGKESLAYCERFSRPYVKAIPMAATAQSENQWLDYSAQFPSARGYLLDSHAPNSMGGSGKTFDWYELAQQRQETAQSSVQNSTQQRAWQHLVLAGGLHAGNVAEAIRVTQPWAVDVSSGVESAPGVKDRAKIQQFVAAVRSSG